MALTDLITYESIRNELRLEKGVDKGYLEELITEATADLETVCNRSFHRVDGIVENVPARGEQRLYVQRWPIRSITSVEFYGEAVHSDDFDWTEGAEWGRIRFRYPLSRRSYVVDRISGRLNTDTEEHDYKITYNGGYMTPNQDEADDPDTVAADVPYGLRRVCKNLVVFRYRERGRNPGIVTEGIEGSSISYEERIEGFPKSIYDAAMNYKRTLVL